ncbi:MAG: DUF1643 domain-containing protein [Bacteroidales bacterium]
MMPRIGRQIPHFEHIELSSVEAVFSGDGCFRYLLSMKFGDTLLDQGRNKTAAVIMKNPSAADEQMADATIRKVETYIYHRLNDVRWLHILNIFAYRATEPEDLNEVFLREGPMKAIGEENDHVIRSTLQECDYVILGWGNTSGIDRALYAERIYRVKQLLKEIPEQKIFCISGKVKTKNPLHGLMWGYDYTMDPAGEYMEMK